ncbi:MAG TPA: transposase [Ktedonobacteraceae bacterium]|nr:transposase [Ktedonobacteraceae bacterium]
MNVREQKGKEIASRLKIERKDNKWIVPSQTGKGKYTVDIEGKIPHCTCPDYELRGLKCKHIYAVEFSIKTETNHETQTTTITKTTRITYKQDWPMYNEAQTHEKALFQSLLYDLCHGIEDPVQTNGRPRFPLRDMAFSAAFKVYSTVSTRRFMCDLSDAHTKGYIEKVPHFNSILNYLDSESLTPILRDLIQTSSLPLKSVEVDFAVDSSGFSTSRYVRWYNARYGHEQDNHDWMKVHLMTGVKTNIVTSVEITGRYSHDSLQFKPLVKTTARNFRMRDVPADKAYSSRANLELVKKLGATPFIPFKSNATGEAEGSVVWEQLYHYYQLNREDFLSHYHKRSNVESTMWMIKSKFDEHIRSKTDTAITNELLCKVLCHNICVVISSMYELGIEPTFCAELPLAQKEGD